VPGTIDRCASRPDALNSADLRESLPYLCAIYPSAAREFQDIDQRQNDKGPALQGFRYFPSSDFTAYQQLRFSFFLKTISDRTFATESINGENLKGKLLNSGDSYIIQTGKEYVNLMPVWDWAKLPGVTSFNGAARIDRHAFTGSVSDGRSGQNKVNGRNEQNGLTGQSGLTVMDYDLTGAPGQRLVARKFWGCHKGWVVCLIGGMRDSGIQKAYTTLDQCRWQDAVTVGHGGSETFLHDGDYALDAANWLWHGGVTTLFLEPVHLEIHAGETTGSWAAINTSGSAAPITEKVFLPLIVHENNASTAYALTAGTTLGETRSLTGHPPCKVIRNDAQLQAIRFTDGMLMAAFYFPGTLRLGNGHAISADHPCLVLVSGKDTFIADPSRQYSVITLHIDQTTRVAHLPDEGTTVAL
jgi:chondroitin AC lyase